MSVWNVSSRRTSNFILEVEAMEKDTSIKKRPMRPHISIHFKCCNVYSRIYLNHKGDAFAGHCPRCAAPVRIRVGQGGSAARIWRAE